MEEARREQLFAEIWALRGQVSRQCYSIVRKLPDAQRIAEDLTQEVMFRAYKNIDQFQGTCKLNVWVYRIAHNWTCSFLRLKTSRQIFLPLEEIIHFEDGDTAISTFEPFVVNHTEESYMSSKLVYELLAELPEPYRGVIVLWSRGYQIKEIAEKLDRPEGTIKSQIHRAKSMARDIMVKLERRRST